MAYFPTDSRYIRSGTSQAFSSGVRTAICWVRAATLPGGGSGICDFYNNSSNTSALEHWSASWIVGDNAGFDNIMSASTATWYCLAITDGAVPGAGNLLGYGKTMSATSWSVSGGSVWGTGPSNAHDIDIGFTRGQAVDFNGEIVGLKCWNTEMGSDELWNESMQLMPVRTANLLAWLPLLNSSDTTNNYQDVSAQSFEETGTGSITDGDMPPVPWGRFKARVVFPVTAAPPTTTHIDLDRGFRKGQPSGLLRGVA